MKSKKGAIEIQFNWIFVLVIGAIILIVFSSIITRQKNLSESSKNVLILNNLDAIISGSESSTGTINTIKIPETTIEFKCNQYSIASFSKQFQVMNIFAPSLLHADRLVTMTLDFSLPFRISNIVYLTSPNYRYILVGNTEISNHIKKIMPNETFTASYDSIGNVKFLGEEKSRFIFFDNFIADGQSLAPNLREYIALQDDKVTALNIKGDLEKGEIEFFEKSNDKFIKKGSSNYVKKETLLGAIFSDNVELYNCVLNNVFKKINIVSQIYKGKMQKIRDSYSQSNNHCSINAETYSLDNIDGIVAASSSFTPENIAEMLNAAENLHQQNNQAQLQSCAVIY